MIDKRKLHDELTETFIEYQYRLDNPMPSPTETKETMIFKYRSDHMFHAKVDRLVGGIMHIIEKHL